MRTQEQISNLRTVLFSMIGIYARFMTDEEINKWADDFQYRLDEIKHCWIVKIRFCKDGDKPWDKILEEPKRPFASLNMMKVKCKDLLEKYPQINDIEITIEDSPSDSHIFNRVERILLKANS